LEKAKVQDDGEPGNWAIENVLSTYLTEGDRYLPESDTVIFAPNKENINQNEQDKFGKTPSQEIFGNNQFIGVATQLFNAENDTKTTGFTDESNNKYQVNFEKTNESKGVYIDQEDARVISYENLKIDIQPFNVNGIKALVNHYENN